MINSLKTPKRLTSLFFAAILLSSCLETRNAKKEDSSHTDTITARTANVETGTVEPKLVERFFPAENMETVNDTTDETSGLKITITEKTLDTYVTNEHGNDSVKYVDKYRDTEWLLKVSRHGDVVVDTVLRKEDFTGHLDNEFLGIANFHGYWIRKIEPDRIEFFGVIAKPETDWSFAFYHYLDLKTGKFSVIEHVDEDI